MMAYIARRTLLAAFTILVVYWLTFVVMRLPDGDYVDYYAMKYCAWAGDVPLPPEEGRDAL